MAKFLLIGSCLETVVDASVQQKTVSVDGIRRTYYVQFPSGSEPADGWPLVFGFHGWNGQASEQASYDGFRTKGRSSAIVVHAEGYSDPTVPGSYSEDSWQSWHGGGSAGVEDGGIDGPICNPNKVTSGGWQCYKSCQKKGFCTPNGGGNNKCRWSHCEDDVGFVLAMIDDVKKTANVNPSQVFASGHSNGAMFMYELASDARTAHVFSAVAPAAGWPHNGFNRGSPNKNLRYINFAGTKDTYVYPYPNVPSDPTESYGTQYGWYYSAWDNTTNLWASQRGLPLSARKTLSVSTSGLSCQGWSDSSAEMASVATCFYEGTHSSPNNVFDAAWNFFGISGSSPTPSPSPSPTPGGCPKTCSGYTCDEWYDYNGNTCAYEEQNYGCDCGGCQCKGGLDTVV